MLSPSLQCVIVLGMQGFTIYTVLAIVWVDNQFKNNAHLGVNNILEVSAPP